MKVYYLENEKGEKFCSGSPLVVVNDNGEKVLFSYCTEIMKETKSGQFLRRWPNWSMTTGRHIKAFCGLNKAGFDSLAFYE